MRIKQVETKGNTIKLGRFCCQFLRSERSRFHCLLQEPLLLLVETLTRYHIEQEEREEEGKENRTSGKEGKHHKATQKIRDNHSITEGTNADRFSDFLSSSPLPVAFVLYVLVCCAGCSKRNECFSLLPCSSLDGDDLHSFIESDRIESPCSQ